MIQVGQRFIHDRSCCAFLGRLDIPPPSIFAGGYDAYYCPTSGSVVVRYGHDGPDYTSCRVSLGNEPIFALDVRLAEARRMAVESGYVGIVPLALNIRRLLLSPPDAGVESVGL